MPKIAYKSFNFSASSRKLIDISNQIIADYQEQGYQLTLRQLYYQLVSRDIIPNKQTEYKRLGSIINDARLAGKIDWSAIEDRTRNLRALSHWENPQEIIGTCSRSFHMDMWETQLYRPEVWIEKDALVGVIERICNEFDVPHFSCRGYTSQSEMWAAGQRILSHMTAEQTPLILHFGDHDPSGKDMSRDIQDRLEMFTEGRVDFQRLALNMDQIRKYNPPPNPAKLTDSRCQAYIADFGDKSWELDALEPSVISALVRDALNEIIDTKKWNKRIKEIKEHKKVLSKIPEKWEEVMEVVQA